MAIVRKRVRTAAGIAPDFPVASQRFTTTPVSFVVTGSSSKFDYVRAST
jgi:hypothetical protein